MTYILMKMKLITDMIHLYYTYFSFLNKYIYGNKNKFLTINPVNMN